MVCGLDGGKDIGREGARGRKVKGVVDVSFGVPATKWRIVWPGYTEGGVSMGRGGCRTSFATTVARRMICTGRYRNNQDSVV